MKGFIKFIVIIIVVALVPGWLYASGNLPFFKPHNEWMVKAAATAYPNFAAFTFHKSHQVFEKLRNKGIEVPYSYNERLFKIRKIRSETIRICNNILSKR